MHCTTLVIHPQVIIRLRQKSEALAQAKLLPIRPSKPSWLSHGRQTGQTVLPRSTWVWTSSCHRPHKEQVRRKKLEQGIIVGQEANLKLVGLDQKKTNRAWMVKEKARIKLLLTRGWRPLPMEFRLTSPTSQSVQRMQSMKPQHQPASQATRLQNRKQTKQTNNHHWLRPADQKKPKALTRHQKRLPKGRNNSLVSQTN